MKKHNAFSAMFDEARKSDTYWTERVLLEFTEEVVARMEALGLSRADLARKIGAKPTYVTRVLNGPNNFTVESMVKITRALDCSIRVHMQPNGAKSHWFDLFDSQRPVVESIDLVATAREYKKPTHTTEAADETLTLAS